MSGTAGRNMAGKMDKPDYLRRRHWADSPWLRAGMRAGGVAVLLGGLLLGLDASGQLAELKQALSGRSAAGMGLLAEQVEVRGLTWQSPRAVLAALDVRPGESLVGFSPARARRLLENLDWVKRAEVLRRYPNGLLITIEERKPVARWRTGGQEVLVDREGVSMALPDGQRFSRLLLVSGAGANRKAATLVNLLAAMPALSSRVRYAEFVGGRRWNLHMRSGLLVLLPERDVGAALQRLALLQERDGILQRALRRLDLRDGRRLVLAVTAPEDAAGGAAAGR